MWILEKNWPDYYSIILQGSDLLSCVSVEFKMLRTQPLHTVWPAWFKRCWGHAYYHFRRFGQEAMTCDHFLCSHCHFKTYNIESDRTQHSLSNKALDLTLFPISFLNSFARTAIILANKKSRPSFLSRRMWRLSVLFFFSTHSWSSLLQYFPAVLAPFPPTYIYIPFS